MCSSPLLRQPSLRAGANQHGVAGTRGEEAACAPQVPVREQRDQRVGHGGGVRGLHEQAVLQRRVNLDRAAVARGHRGQPVRGSLDQREAERLLQRDVDERAVRGRGDCAK